MHAEHHKLCAFLWKQSIDEEKALLCKIKNIAICDPWKLKQRDIKNQSHGFLALTLQA